MLKIGEFSKLAMVTVKTLRFYDEVGLLKPHLVDEWTGYRYYDSRQLYEIHRIVALRQAGLTIDEIKSVMSGNNTLEILESRQNELETEMTALNERILRITKFINEYKENKVMKFQITIKEIESVDVFYGIKKLHSFDDLGGFIVGIGAECAESNPDVKCVNPDYCFVSYLDDEFSPIDFTAMYAQAVEKKGVDSGNIKFKTMPSITAASILVKGDYSNLPLAYAYAMEWLNANGYAISDPIRERYIDGCWNKENPDDYLTEIQIPVKKA